MSINAEFILLVGINIPIPDIKAPGFGLSIITRGFYVADDVIGEF